MSFNEARARVEYLHSRMEEHRGDERNEYHELLRQFPKLRTAYRRRPKTSNQKN